MAVVIKISGYVTKFSHWRSNGEGESIQKANEEGMLFSVQSPYWKNRSSYEARPSTYSIYQNYIAKKKLIYLITNMYLIQN